MISLVRVDSRLIHGQVVEAWLPHLKVARILVADETAAKDPLSRAAMGIAVEVSTEVRIQPPSSVDFPAIDRDFVPTLVLFRQILDVVEARRRGLRVDRLNLGNVHHEAGKRKVSPSVFLSLEELNQLKILSDQGSVVEAQAVPSDRPVGLSEIAEQFKKGS